MRVPKRYSFPILYLKPWPDAQGLFVAHIAYPNTPLPQKGHAMQLTSDTATCVTTGPAPNIQSSCISFTIPAWR